MNKPSKDALEKVNEDIKEKKRKRGGFFKFKTANKEKIKPKALGWISNADNLTGFGMQNRGNRIKEEDDGN
jgi:hypothetical protein